MKRKVGRPKKVIDYEAVGKLARLHCTIEEIASFLGVHRDTLHNDSQFSDVYKAAKAEGAMSLRRKQWAAAEEGNTTMLIWLGKQYLGQREPKQEVEHSGNQNAPLVIRPMFSEKSLADD